MENHKTKTVVQGALLLTIAGLLSKVLSATYRIPLQNLTGDFGFYIYQQVYPLIGMVMILALYGFPVAISKLTAEMNRDNKEITYRNFYGPLLFILYIINTVFFLFLLLMSPYIAIWTGDENLTGTFQFAACLFLLIPLLALFRGVFQGNNEMKQTACSQMIEQSIRVCIIIFAAYFIFAGKLDIYQIGQAGVMATMIGMIVAMIVLAVLFIRENPPSIQTTKTKIPWRYYGYTCVTFGIAASLNQMILIMIQIIDVVTLVPNLMEYGLAPIKAMETKGVFDRGQPLIQFGVVFGSSFALALIPAVIRENLQKNQEKVHDVREALLFSFYLAAGATIGLIFILPETNLLLFTNQAGTGSLQILVIAILLSSVTITTCAILQSLGFIKQIAIWICIALIVKWFLNELFVPYWGIHGSAVATVSSLLLLCCAVLRLLHKQLPTLRLLRSIHWLGFIIASSAMSVYIVIVKYVGSMFIQLSRPSLMFYVLFIVLSGAFIYVSFLLRYNVFTKKQLNAFPFSTLFLQLQKVVAKDKIS